MWKINHGLIGYVFEDQFIPSSSKPPTKQRESNVQFQIEENELRLSYVNSPNTTFFALNFPNLKNIVTTNLMSNQTLCER